MVNNLNGSDARQSANDAKVPRKDPTGAFTLSRLIQPRD